MNELYGNTLNGLVKNGIRLSYSKNPLGVRAQSVTPAGPPPSNGPLGIQEAFQGRQMAPGPPLSMPLDIGHQRPRDDNGSFSSYASSPPSRFFPAAQPGPPSRQSFGQFSPQYSRPQASQLVPVSGHSMGPASPPPMPSMPSAYIDHADERLLSTRDPRHYPLSTSPGLEVARAA